MGAQGRSKTRGGCERSIDAGAEARARGPSKPGVRRGVAKLRGAAAKHGAQWAQGSEGQGAGQRGAGRGAAGRGQAQQVRADKAGWGGAVSAAAAQRVVATRGGAAGARRGAERNGPQSAGGPRSRQGRGNRKSPRSKSRGWYVVQRGVGHRDNIWYGVLMLDIGSRATEGRQRRNAGARTQEGENGQHRARRNQRGGGASVAWR
jgi:hypothetical protein